MQAENRTARAWLFKWRYSLHEDILLLHLTSELVDLRKGCANSILLRRVKLSSATSTKNNSQTARAWLLFFGRSVEIRTPGLQYPNHDFCVFDYQSLHIAHIFRKIASFCTFVPLFTRRKILVVVSYVVKLF